jgi:hypothetical protein
MYSNYELIEYMYTIAELQINEEIFSAILGEIGNRNPCQRQVLRDHFRQ